MRLTGFTKAQKDAFYQFGLLVGLAETGMPELRLGDEDAEILKRMSADGFKILDSLIARMDREMAERLIHEMSVYQLAVVGRTGTYKDDERVVSAEALDTLLENAFENCKHCEIQNHKKCRLRQCLLKMGAPVFDEEAKGVCPYKWTD